MTLEQLKELLESGKFHHATYRNIGTLWEGLHIYERATDAEGGCRGFKHFGAFIVGPPHYAEHAANKKLADQAYELVRHSGVSVGSYGNG